MQTMTTVYQGHARMAPRAQTTAGVTRARARPAGLEPTVTSVGIRCKEHDEAGLFSI